VKRTVAPLRVNSLSPASVAVVVASVQLNKLLELVVNGNPEARVVLWASNGDSRGWVSRRMVSGNDVTSNFALQRLSG
jgi:hypothetical protein